MAGAPHDTRAQKIVDEAMAKYPDLLILMLHATPPTGGKNIVIGSSIARIGKEADEDDMLVVNTGKVHLEVDPAGNRYEVETRLKDQAGKVVGALGMVFAYKEGDDTEALHKRGNVITADVSRKVASSASLFQPAK